MEKIDELFEKSLKNLEVKPSERANVLFESRLKEKKGGSRKVWIYWSMAASIGFVFFTFLGIRLKNSNDQIQVATNIVADTDKSGTEIATKNESLLVFSKKRTEMISENKSNVSKGKIEKTENDAPPALDVVTTVPLISSESKPSLIAKTFPVDKMENQSKMPSKSNDENLEAIVYLSPLVSLNSETMKQVVNFPKVEKKSANQDYFNDEKSLIVRVAEEVKGLKKGEKVDFNKLGIKPIEEWSKDEDGFIASETREFKERYTRIKTFLTSK